MYKLREYTKKSSWFWTLLCTYIQNSLFKRKCRSNLD